MKKKSKIFEDNKLLIENYDYIVKSIKAKYDAIDFRGNYILEKEPKVYLVTNELRYSFNIDATYEKYLTIEYIDGAFESLINKEMKENSKDPKGLGL